MKLNELVHLLSKEDPKTIGEYEVVDFYDLEAFSLRDVIVDHEHKTIKLMVKEV